MRDNTGHDVPVKYVSKYDRLRDEKTKRVLARFRKARTVLEAVVLTWETFAAAHNTVNS